MCLQTSITVVTVEARLRCVRRFVPKTVISRLIRIGCGFRHTPIEGPPPWRFESSGGDLIAHSIPFPLFFGCHGET